MAKQKKSDNYFFNLVLLVTAFIITAVSTLTGSHTQDGYNLKVGDISDRKIKATRRIENTVATEKNRFEAEKAALDVKPTLKKDTEINERVIKNVTDLFIELDTIRAVYQTELAKQAEAEREAAKVPDEPEPTEPSDSNAPEPSVTDAPELDNQSSVVSLDTQITNANMVPGDGGEDPLMPLTAMEQLETLQLTLSDSQRWLLMNMDDENYGKLKHATRQSLENVLEQGVQDVDAKSLLSIQDEMFEFDITSDMRNIGYQIASSYLEPNYIEDVIATKAARQEIASRYTVEYK